MKKITSSIAYAFSCAIAIVSLSAPAAALPPLVGDGCLPGDPCYVAPPRAQPKPIPVEIIEPEPVTPIVIEEDECEYPLYATVGASYVFMEKDETVLNHLMAPELKIGFYRMLDYTSFEFGAAYSGRVRNREHPNPGAYRLPQDTQVFDYFADFLFHLTDEEEGFDPYLTLGGGLKHYRDKLEDGDHTALYAAAGAGAFMNISEQVFFKPDYRVMMVDEDTEVNQKASLALGVRF